MQPLHPLKYSLVQLHARIVASGLGSGAAIVNGHRFHHQQQQQHLRHQRSPVTRKKMIRTVWNIVSILNDHQYHMFFSSFHKYNLVWYPNHAHEQETAGRG